MSRLFKRVFIGVRQFALATDAANAVRHGAPIPDHARNHAAPGKPGAPVL